MPSFQLDLPRRSLITVIVPYDEIKRTEDLLDELVSHPQIIAADHQITVAGNGQPSIAAKHSAERIELESEGDVEARAYVGLADRLRQCAWSIVFCNTKERIQLAKTARGDNWELEKAIGQLTHYLSMRLDYDKPMATLVHNRERTDGT